MGEDPPNKRDWSDADLSNAVAESRSWRGVMRGLGLCVTSAGSIRVVKRRVALLGLDTSHLPQGIKRVQVKTTTYLSKTGWQVGVGRRPYSIGNREPLVPYDPELIDWFFIVDGDLNSYLIPSQVIGGRVGILLRTYSKYIVGSAAGLMAPSPHAA